MLFRSVVVEHFWLRRLERWLHAVHRPTPDRRRLHVVDGLMPWHRRLRGRHRRRLFRPDERELAPLRDAERADEVAVRDAGGDAVEVERVGALGREDGLPPAGAHAAEAYGARIALHPTQQTTSDLVDQQPC